MRDYYTKAEAAHIMGVSERSISNYIKEGKLRKVVPGKKVLIPVEDVERWCTDRDAGLPPGREEFNELLEQVSLLRGQIESVQGSLGFGVRRSRKSEEELLAMHTEHLDELRCVAWRKDYILQVTKDVMSLREDEMEFLFQQRGPRGWKPTFDLLQKFLKFIEGKSSYPEGGLEALHQRVDQAIQRLYALVHISTKTHTSFKRDHAQKLLDELEYEPCAIDRWIARGIARSTRAATN